MTALDRVPLLKPLNTTCFPVNVVMVADEASTPSPDRVRPVEEAGEEGERQAASSYPRWSIHALVGSFAWKSGCFPLSA
jgi:hypothetical protein